MGIVPWVRWLRDLDATVEDRGDSHPNSAGIGRERKCRGVGKSRYSSSWKTVSPQGEVAIPQEPMLTS